MLRRSLALGCVILLVGSLAAQVRFRESAREHFPLEAEPVIDLQLGDVDGDDLSPGSLEPPVSRGARDASADCVLDIAGRSDEFTKAMVISA